MAEPPADAHPRRRATVTHSEIEATGESILYDAAADRAVVVSPLAAVVWLLCDGTRDLDALTDTLAERFADVPRARIRDDVAAFLTVLADEGMLAP